MYIMGQMGIVATRWLHQAPKFFQVIGIVYLCLNINKVICIDFTLQVMASFPDLRDGRHDTWQKLHDKVAKSVDMSQ
jgi:hypothetical protein